MPKGTPMKEGECRMTKHGRTYCKIGGKVRFKPGDFRMAPKRRKR